MSLDGLRHDLVRSPSVADALAELQARFIEADMPSVHRAHTGVLDWNRLLLLASVLAGGSTEPAVTAALRIAQGCLVSEETSERERAAAGVVLERMGNRNSVRLAEQRDLLSADHLEQTPVPLQLDVIRRRLELSIPGRTRERWPVSPFQRRFWDLAGRYDWLSISAPTSAGKSWIVMRWLEHRMYRQATFRGAYVVPTRALVDEVAYSLAEQLSEDVAVHTIPWDAAIGERDREVFVMTQERMQLLMHAHHHLRADVVFVDEAQKFADDSRGILLQRTLNDLVRRNDSTQVIFASPMSANPELLVRDAPRSMRTYSEVVEAVTVNQSLLWADAIKGKPKDWTLRAPDAHSEPVVGTFQLVFKATNVSQRLPLAAFSLAGDSQGNVLYVNGAADAEKAALQLAGLLSRAKGRDLADLEALRELARESIHPQYALAATLRHGVAYHYGNMPLLVRAEIERLFRTGAIRYLVCTSTLLEGVNLPCRNLFVRGPTRGRGKPMTSADFWNLAGRAGRWGKEFQGNIVCVDVANPAEWPVPPRVRTRTVLRRASDDALVDVDRLVGHARAGAPKLNDDRAHDLSEAMLSLLAVAVVRGESVESVGDFNDAPPLAIAELDRLLQEALAAQDLPAELVERHAGISPQAMNRLLGDFAANRDITEFLVDQPTATNALGTYKAALNRCASAFGAPFGGEKRQWQLAYLVTDWMRGRPLAYLIQRRLQLNARAVKPKTRSAVIREVMSDVESVARFHAPKFLACYLDLLKLYLTREGETDLAVNTPELDMLLELGVPQPTQMVLLSLGLSRTTTIAVSEYLIGDNLSRDECIAWLHAVSLDVLPLPELSIRELHEVRRRHPSRGA